MRRAPPIAAGVMTLSLFAAGGAVARADHGPDGHAGVVLVRRPGVIAYEEVVEEFLENSRVRARVVSLDDGGGPALRASLDPDDVVVTIGQAALDAVAGTPAQVVSVLAYAVPPGVVAIDPVPPPELTLRALKRARPSVRRVAAVFGPQSDALFRRVAAHAPALGMKLIPVRATDGADAIRELHRVSPHIDAMWLAPDLQVLTPQLFRYALLLELELALPVAAVTRQQVQSGALLAYDASPRDLGRQAAHVVHLLLTGVAPLSLPPPERGCATELSVNFDVARRLGVDGAALEAMGARLR